MDIPGSCEGRRIGNVLLRPPVKEVLPDVENERGDRQEEDESAGKENEDLTPLPSCAASC
jgi:hypothetical protein